jgi:F-type H+-transporting ATPase subunit delta
MITHKVAHRYAKSLLDLAIDQNSLEDVKSDMDLVGAFYNESKDFKNLLKSPVIRGDMKKKSLQAIFTGRLSKIGDSFVDILLLKGREYLLGEISESFINQYNKYKNIVIAEVTSAAPMNDANRKEIRTLIGKMHEGEIQITEKVDPELIGGFVIRIDDQQIDSSVIKELNLMRRELNENPYIAEL